MKCNEAATLVIQKLIEKMPDATIHRYDAYSSSSVYLKVDYGVGGSIRIGDHKGKDYLAYRFNLVIGRRNATKQEVTSGCNTDQRYYGEQAIDLMVTEIDEFRAERMLRYRGYTNVVNKVANEVTGSEGFWHSARKITA